MNIYLGEFHREHLCGLRLNVAYIPHMHRFGLQLLPALGARPAGAILRQRSPAGRAPAPGPRQDPWQSHTRTQQTRTELPQLRNCDNTRSSLKNTTSTEK